MSKWIALFRGINVGGKNKLAMAELKDTLGELGLTGVKTYIQSGNAVFGAPDTDAAGLAEKIGLAVQRSHGFRPQVLVMSQRALRRAIQGNPFSAGLDDGSPVHLFFLSGEPPAPDTDKLDALKTPTEEWKLAGEVFYLHAPDGFGRSKLAASAERLLGVPATARNWRSVGKIMELAEQPD